MARARVLRLLPLCLSLLLAACGADGPGGSSGMMDEPTPEPVGAESFTPPPEPVYQAISLTNGGTITGTIRLAGAAPPRPDLVVERNQAVCGEHRPDPSLVLGNDNTVANVVVSLRGIARGKEMEVLREPAKLDQVECEYVPHLQAFPVGTTLEIVNSDPVLHNVHGYLNETESIFNLAMPLEGYRIQRTLDVPGIVSVKCDAGHAWMSAYLVVQEHPYYAVTDEDGSYSLDDVPPGNYRLKLWHEWLGETDVPVEVEPDATAAVDLELSAAAVDSP